MIEFAKKEKQGRSTLNKYDVSVTYSLPHGSVNHGSSGKTLRFSFTERAVKMICGGSRYAMVGIDKDFPERIYFCPADEINGYKMSKADKQGTRYSCTFGNGINYINVTSFIGFYNLEYDAKQGALYISKKNKKGETENESN